ncbi:MAG: DEAD/DEAH box helicase [archaeon]
MVDIKDFTPRRYQESILNTSVKNNTLVVLPTGLGKTKTAILIAVQRLNTYPQSKILFLTPTKPLAAQIHKEFIANTTLDKNEIKLFTGMIKPSEREKQWQEAKVIISTPQGCANDIISKKIDLKDVSCLVFDEVHHALGNYDYCFIAKNYNQTAKYPRIIGLTASPGSDTETINEICKNTFIEAVETRAHEDEDVKEYVQEVELDYVTVDLPDEIKEIKKILQGCLDQRLQTLKELGLTSSIKSMSKGNLLGIQKEIQKRIISGEKDSSLWLSASKVAEAIKVYHALELAETQGMTALNKYFNKIYQEAEKTKTKATKNIAADPEFKKAYLKAIELKDKEIEHPKLAKLKELIQEEISKDENAKIIVFNNYRDSGAKIAEELNKLSGVDCKLFVGQMKKGETGMSQKEQLQMLEEFRQGLFNTIVATSIGEEGLDIASVNLVVFYEPVPSAIRSIQRKGRTARLEKGAVKILVTKNTRDEAYRWTAHHKEKRMHRILGDLKNNIKLTKQPTLQNFTEDKVMIYADTREASSGILKELSEIGTDVKIQQLNAGDFLISERVCVERKELNDFISSIIDKRLLQQIKALKDNFERPVLILEGMEDIYSIRKMHPNAIRGMLTTIAVDYGIPILRTKDYKDTAAMLKIMAKHEQKGEVKDFGVRTERKPLTTKEQQEFIIESLPGVGPTLAKSLLREFKTVKNIINTEDLTRIDKLGKKKSEEIQRILEEEYEE